MKKISKALSFILVLIMTTSCMAVNGYAVATPLEAGSSMETAVNIPEYGVEYVSSLSTTGEVDWFKFTTKSEDAYYFFKFKNYNIEAGWNDTQTPNAYIYDQNSQLIYSGSNNFTSSIKLENSVTYYVKVCMGYNRPENTGNYEISLNAKFDPDPNEMLSATPIEINNKYIRDLDGTGDVDWFKFTAPVNGLYEIRLHNVDIAAGWNDTQTPNLHVLDINKQELAYQYCLNGDAVANIDLELNQTYYIKVCMGYNRPEYTGSYEISVNKDLKFLSGISIASLPAKTVYEIGESFNPTGPVINANYSDGTTAEIVDYTVSGFDSSTAGIKTITVSYVSDGSTYTCTFDVVINAAASVELTGIAYITLPSKTTYKLGESFDKTGLTVSAQYSDGSSKLISSYTISGFDSTTAGVKTIVVTYSENGIAKSCKFTVTVVSVKSLIAISVAAAPTKTTYQLNEAFDAAGLVINAYYDNGTSSFVTDYTLSGFDSSTAGTKTIIVTYTENGVTKSCTFDVIVQESDNAGNFFTDLFARIIDFFISIINFIAGIFG